MLENIGQFVPFMLLIVVNWCLALAGLILLIVNRQRIKLQPAEKELPKNKRFPAAVFNYGFLILFAVCGVMPYFFHNMFWVLMLTQIVLTDR